MSQTRLTTRLSDRRVGPILRRNWYATIMRGRFACQYRRKLKRYTRGLPAQVITSTPPQTPETAPDAPRDPHEAPCLE